MLLTSPNSKVKIEKVKLDELFPLYKATQKV